MRCWIDPCPLTRGWERIRASGNRDDTCLSSRIIVQEQWCARLQGPCGARRVVGAPSGQHHLPGTIWSPRSHDRNACVCHCRPSTLPTWPVVYCLVSLAYKLRPIAALAGGHLIIMLASSQIGRADHALVATATMLFIFAFCGGIYTIFLVIEHLMLIIASVVLLLISIMRCMTLCCGKQCHGPTNSIVTMALSVAVTSVLFDTANEDWYTTDRNFDYIQTRRDTIRTVAVLALIGTVCEFGHLIILFMHGVPENDGTYRDESRRLVPGNQHDGGNGGSTRALKFCPKCGAGIDGNPFCGACGAKIGSSLSG